MRDPSLPRQRSSSFWRGAGFALGARGLQVAYGLVSIPIGLWHFGPNTYGAWLVISSIVSYLSLASLGAPNTVLTWTARFGPGHAKSVLLRGVWTTGSASAVLSAGLVLAANIVPATTVAGLVASEDADVGIAILLMAGATFVSLPLACATASLAGQGRVEAQQAIQAAHLVSNLAALLVTVASGGSVVVLAQLTVAGRLLVGGAGVLWRIRAPFELSGAENLNHRRGELPGVGAFLASSGRFFIMGLQGTVTVNVDQLILAHVLGPAAVPGYVAVLRLVQGLELAVTAILAPAWPAFGRHLRPGAPRDSAADLLDSTLRVAQSAMAALAVPAAVLGTWVLAIWLQDAAVAQEARSVLLPLLAWSFVHVSLQTQSTFLVAADRTGRQTLLGFADAGMNIALSLMLAPVFGALGVALATLISAVTVYYPGLVILVRSELGPGPSRRVTGTQRAGILWPLALLLPALLQQTSLALEPQAAIAGSGVVAILWCGRHPIRRSVERLRTVSLA